MNVRDAIYIFANGLSLSIATGLAFVTLIQPRRTALNGWFTLFLASIALWAYFTMARVSPQMSPFTEEHDFYLLFTGLILAPVTLYLFVAALTHPPDLPARFLAGWAGLFVFGMSVLLWSGRVVEYHPSNGTRYGFDLLLPGYVALGHIILYGLAAVLYLRLSHNPQAHSLQLPAVLLLLGYGSNIVMPLRGLPLDIILTTIAAILVGYAVLRWQLFNPLGEANEQLRATNAELRSVINDLAAEKARAEQLNDDLREASRYKSEFLANMSHELRTPLNSIVGYSELMLKGIYGPLGDKQSDRMEKIHRNGLNLLALINDILDLSKIEGGRLELNLSTVRVPALVDGLLGTVEPMAASKQLALEVDLESPLRLVRADELRIRQVLLNLLSNAVKFTPAGRVRLSARNITVKNGRSAEFQLPVLGWLEDRHWLLLSVEDTGIGIAPEEQASIFEEFRQAGGGAAHQEGVGLGLAIAKRLVELHTGRIWVRSKVGQGSTFYIALPALDVYDEPAELTLPAPLDRSSALLLVASDDKSAGVLIAALRTHSYRVVRVLDGPSGVARAHELRPAAILVDVLMPDLAGWEALCQFRSSAATADTPLLLASVIDGQPTGLPLGPGVCLSRPVQRGDLLAALAHLQLDMDSSPALVVSEDAAQRDLLCSFLSAETLPVDQCAGGRAALDRLGGLVQRPGLIVLDLFMSPVSGFEVLLALRQNPHLAGVPVILLREEHPTAETLNQFHTQLVQALRLQDVHSSDTLIERLQAELA